MAEKLNGWAKDEAEFRDAGFTDEEIGAERSRLQGEMQESGFAGPEINEFFGAKNPDMAPVRQMIEQNFAKAAAAPVDPTKPKAAGTFLESLDAGWQMSVSGLFARGQKPDTILPEDAPTFYRIASQVSTLAGDVPAMIAGGMAGAPIGGAAGGAAGSVVPVLGTAVGGAAGSVVGAAAGANALPVAMRETLMSYYEKGEVRDFSDFWERATPIFLETAKASVVGGVSGGAGAAVGRFAPIAAPLLRSTAASTAEVATMVSAGRALEGQVPKAQDFTDAALLVGALTGSAKVASKIRGIYAKTGVSPFEIAQEAMSNPVVKQDLLTSNKEIPDAYLSLVEGGTQDVSVNADAPPPLPVDAQLTQRSSTLMDLDGTEPAFEFRPERKPEVTKPEITEAQRTESENAVLERIGKEADQPKKSYDFDTFYTDVVERLNPINSFTKALTEGRPVTADKNPYFVARNMPGVGKMVEQFLEHKPFKYDSKESVGKSFKEIFEPIKTDVDGFEAFLVSARTLELEARGIKTGVPLDDARVVVEAGRAKYEKAQKEMVEFQNHALSYLKDSGILSAETFAKMTEANQDYVPFYRLMDDQAALGKRGPARGLGVKNPIKKIEGSEREIIRPLESIIKNVETYITLAERNRVARTMVELAESNPTVGDTLIERVDVPKDLSASKEVLEVFKEIGLENAPEVAAMFRPESIALSKDTIAVFRDGKRESYRVAPEIAEAMKNMDGGTTNIFVKIMALPVRTAKAGILLTPDFALRNFMRDQVTAFANSENGYVPFKTAIETVGSLWSKDASYQAWLKSGGANASMKTIGEYINNDVYKLSRETGLIDKTWNVIKTPMEAMGAMSELLENITRLGEFKKATAGGNTAEAMAKGAYSSREITVDMARMGAKTRALNQIIAFWNIGGIQGTDRLLRQFKDQPVRTSAKLAASVTIPSMLLWWANKDDPRWKEIPRWQKDMFWIVMTKDHVFKIPKPHAEGLIFGSLPERAMEAFTQDNPRAMKDLGETFVGAFAPGFVPTAAAPIIEQQFNKSFFTGASIVPSNLEKVLPEYQYTEYTTESGKILGKMVGAVPGMRESTMSSPMVIENYVRAWGGTLGMYALKAADELLYKSGAVKEPVRPASTLADIPFVKAFVLRHPSASAQSIQDFYDRFGENKKVIDTVRHLARQGDFPNMKKELSLQQNQDKLMSLDGVREALSNQSKFIQMVNRNEKMKPAEKRQVIDGIYNNMIQTARFGNKTMEALEKAQPKD